jgi:hypothetical protein
VSDLDAARTIAQAWKHGALAKGFEAITVDSRR